jgi:hypothetical protein
LALEYDFYLDSEIDDVAINTEVKKFSAKDGRSEEHPPLSASSFEVTPYMEENILAHFGFTPKTGITFSLDKFAEPGIAGERLILVSIALLQNEKISNGALLFGGEVPVFQYSDKVLFLNESRGYWTPKKTSLLAVPFHFKKIPNL